MDSPIAKALKAIAATLVAVLGLMFAVGAYAGFQASTVENTCTSIALGSPAAAALQRATERGLAGAPEAVPASGEVVLHNDLPPFMRASCTLTIEGGAVTGTRLAEPRRQPG
jgi:hypothetical protein